MRRDVFKPRRRVRGEEKQRGRNLGLRPVLRRVRQKEASLTGLAFVRVRPSWRPWSSTRPGPCLTRALNATSSRMAMSERTLRSSSILRGLEAFDEAAVGDACGAASRVEADDPQGPRISPFFFLRSGRIGILPGMLDSVFGIAEQLGFIPEVALGVLQHFLTAACAKRGSWLHEPCWYFLY
jgi:hypothetical protein